MSAWWLSYALDDGRSYVCIVDAESFLAACQRVRQLGLSPGGEVLGFPLPAEMPEHGLPRDRLLSEEELREVGAEKLGELDMAEVVLNRGAPHDQ